MLNLAATVQAASAKGGGKTFKNQTHGEVLRALSYICEQEGKGCGTM